MSVALIATAAVSFFGLAVFVWSHRAEPGARALAGLLLAADVWSALYSMELIATTESAAIWFSNLKFIGIVALPPLLLTFVVQYTGMRSQLSRGTQLGLSVHPVLVLTLVAIPATCGLIHTFAPNPTGPGKVIVFTGPLFWPHAFYSYALMLSAILLLIARLARVARPYRRGAAVMSLASIAPVAANVVYNAAIFPSFLVDPTPYLLVITAVVLVWGFFRLRFVDVMGVARSAIVDKMADAVLVLDSRGRVMDANPATASLLKRPLSQVLGKTLSELVPSLGSAVRDRRSSQTSRFEVHLPEAELALGPTDLSVLMSTIPYPVPQVSGQVVVLRDVSVRNAADRQMMYLFERQRRINETLELSLRPASLPEVPGAWVCSRWVPSRSTDGAEVSGDFFDVHPADGKTWAFALGDVSGKGVEAAVVTAMARYTVRTLTQEHDSTSEVLEGLNRALLAETQNPERFCTLAYGRVTASDVGLSVRIALGGHPPLFVVRADGCVSLTGEVGTVLGLMEVVEARESLVHLAPGDALVAYTDGVTEARRNGEFFGEERLASVLAQAAQAAPAGAGRGEHLAQTVIDALTEYSTHRDDLALLVMVAQGL